MKGNMKKAVIEILYEGEPVLGSRTNGQYLVREYEDEEELGGSFYKTIEEAEARVLEYQNIHIFIIYLLVKYEFTSGLQHLRFLAIQVVLSRE